MENEHTMIHRMDHSSHPYGFEHEMNSSFRLKQGSSIWSQTNDGVDSNYLLVSSVYSQQNTPLSYSHYELKNETFPFIKNRKVSGNLLRVKVVNDGHFQIIAPYGRCCQPSKLTNIFQSSLHEDSTEDPCKERTSTTAKQNDCLVATNAGFFDVPHGYCIGRVISNGKVLNTASGHNAVFGFIDHADHPQYLYGYVNDTELTKLKPTQLVQGALWLVREGKSFVNESIKIEKTSQAFCDLAAPRVAIGNDINGNLMILQVNGYEPQKLGLNVYEMTDLLLFLGFQNAVNLDGGGSATTFIKGYPTLFNTCSDSCSEIEGNMCPNAKIGRCERHVTTIVCLK
ncbi:hypothetical protein C9374_008270 [Naegleria lovaniensis]|uniref:Phosphodiester glycosidase domain-containing protein n=1 Tax=Naegleria lovaniensis TaxID=51637 RepID=A0AA88GK20_NAELO|nr:uncharacterized protein C9374_008270 [Naegleria lovaniensis]KAG2378631.1 hypothetical protein C9374_008270 [Naegleria lovaniensis]